MFYGQIVCSHAAHKQTSWAIWINNINSASSSAKHELTELMLLIQSALTVVYKEWEIINPIFSPPFQC